MSPGMAALAPTGPRLKNPTIIVLPFMIPTMFSFRYWWDLGRSCFFASTLVSSSFVHDVEGLGDEPALVFGEVEVDGVSLVPDLLLFSVLERHLADVLPFLLRFAVDADAVRPTHRDRVGDSEQNFLVLDGTHFGEVGLVHLLLEDGLWPCRWF